MRLPISYQLILSLLVLTQCASEAPHGPEDRQRPVENESLAEAEEALYAIHHSDTLCSGKYEGPEFIVGDDVAHQLSNAMSKEIGIILKRLYAEGKYSKVDFDGIRMRTEGMGTGTVKYTLSIPLKRVKAACDAYTSFDHCGGWGHPPELTVRKAQLKSALMKGEQLNISRLMRTPEGLEEYWIQWRNKEVQADCRH